MSSVNVRQRGGARPLIFGWSSLFVTLFAIGSIPSLFADIQSDEPSREIAVTRVPIILSKGGEIVAKENSTIYLECDTDFESKEFVLMWKSASLVLFADNITIRNKPGVSLNPKSKGIIIERLSSDLVGEYRCEISATSPNFIVYNVSMATPPVITSSPLSAKKTVAKGKSFHLDCNVKASSFPVTFKWIQNSKIIELNSSRFEKNHVKPEDGGEYICVATNEIGESSFTFAVTVTYEPEISLSDMIVHGAIGNDVQVECDVNAYPEAQIAFFFGNNSAIRPSSKHEIRKLKKTTILIIKNVSPSDYDSYYCMANNSIGTRTSYFEVTGKPSVPKFISPSVGNNLETYFLQWTVDSQSQITNYKLEIRPVDPVMERQFEWRQITFNPPQEQGPHHKYSQLLENLSNHNNYEVKLHVENEFGKTESQVFAFATADFNGVCSKTSGWTVAILLLISLASSLLR